ncbi:peptidoglycan recognition family protein [Nonomuraea salmonea]|uniref:peptidoglycan recognition protein family protein n=1 Tax=Nonomuraea salmonea TaxID=46181 RepID=UPI002FEAF346
MQFVARQEWKASKPRGKWTNLARTKGVKIHYTGGKVSPKLVDDHDRCVALVRSIQSQHQKGNGWIDIGYTYAVCPHRHIFVGRGAHHLPAANGPGLNSGHYAVLALVGSSGLVKPPPLMLAGIWDAITYLRKHGGARARRSRGTGTVTRRNARGRG